MAGKLGSFKDLRSWDGYGKADKFLVETFKMGSDLFDLIKRNIEVENSTAKSLNDLGSLKKKRRAELESGDFGTLGQLYVAYADKTIEQAKIYEARVKSLLEVSKLVKQMIADKDKQRKNLNTKAQHHLNAVQKAQKEFQKAESNYQSLKTETESPAFQEKPSPKKIEKMHQADGDRKRLEGMSNAKDTEWKNSLLPACFQELQDIVESFYTEFNQLMTMFVEKYRQSFEDFDGHFDSVELEFGKLERGDIEEFLDRAQDELQDEGRKKIEDERQKELEAERERQRKIEKEERQKEKELRRKEMEERKRERQEEMEQKAKEREEMLTKRRERELQRKREEEERRARIKLEELEAQKAEDERRKAEGPPPAYDG